MNRNIVRVALAAATAIAWMNAEAGYMGSTQYPGTFQPIQEPVCVQPLYASPFTEGKQYNDPYNNGVVNGQYFMLMRWQDYSAGSVSYDLGRWTGLHNVPQSGQFGRIPENTAGSPGAQANCYDAGMLLNTWETPHRPVIGGGYNDMYGYSWGVGSNVRPFIQNGVKTDLVLQANLGVSTYVPSKPDPNHPDQRITTTTAGSGQLVFFAYVRDTTGSLPPIAIIAGAYDSQFGGFAGNIDIDYDSALSSAFKSNPSLSQWFANDNSNSGVWFATGPVSMSPTNTNQYINTWYTAGEDNAALQPVDMNGAPSMPFFRAHVSWQNMANIITGIKNSPCPTPNGMTCLSKGYSTDPADYELVYAGVIAETTVANERAPNSSFDASPTNWVVDDQNKWQVSLGAHIYALGFYRAVPN
jgi:hypothetical protein